VSKYGPYIWPVLTAVVWLVYFAVTLSVPVTGQPPTMLTQASSILVGILLLLCVLFAGERPNLPSPVRLAIFIAGLLIVGAAFFFNLHSPAYRGVIALGLMGIALPVGYWVGNQMEKVTNLVPIAVAFTFADIFSVFQGPSSKAVEDIQEFDQEKADRIAEAVANMPPEEAVEAAHEAAASIRAPLADYVVVQFPVPGTGTTQAVLGIGDFVIMALLFRVAWVHGINPVAVLVSGIVSIFVALVVSSALRLAIPALPFIAVGVIGYLLVTNPRLRRLERQEILLSVVVAAIFIGLMALRWYRAVTG